jgi:hypothetical protein
VLLPDRKTLLCAVVWFSGVPGDFWLALWLTLGGCAVGRCLLGDAGTVWSMSAGCAAVGAARASAGASAMVNLKLGYSHFIERDYVKVYISINNIL